MMLSSPAWEYMVDAAQRSVLFWDVMRQRGDQYREHLSQTTPHVLDFEAELVVDGRTCRGRSIMAHSHHPAKDIKIDRRGGHS